MASLIQKVSVFDLEWNGGAWNVGQYNVPPTLGASGLLSCRGMLNLANEVAAGRLTIASGGTACTITITGSVSAVLYDSTTGTVVASGSTLSFTVGGSGVSATDLLFVEVAADVDTDFTYVCAPVTSAAAVQLLYVLNDVGSCLKCSTGISGAGSIVYVAKDPLLRCTTGNISGETVPLVGAVTYSYTIANTDGSGFQTWQRAVTGSVAESDYITPALIYNRQVYVISCPTVTLDGYSCTALLLGAYAWGT